MTTLFALLYTLIGLSLVAVVVAPQATLLALSLAAEFIVAIVLTAILRTAAKRTPKQGDER